MVITLLAAWLTADFLSGLVHWWEDRYGNPEWPIIGRHVIAPNIQHHTDQMAFTIGSYWFRNWTTIVPAAVLASFAYLAGLWFLALALVFLSQANEVHSWAHQRCCRQIRGLQLLGLCHSPEQHAKHHKQPYDRNYCAMSDLMNPVLSGINAWPAVEWLIARVTGIKPRPEREFA